MASGSFKVISTFGWTSGGYKALLKSNRTNNRFLVWYYDSLGIEPGDEAVVTADDSWSYWSSVGNPRTGRNSNVSSWNKVD